MKSRFAQVIVIGYGKTAAEVLGFVADKQRKYGYEAVFIEHEVKGIPDMQAVCSHKQMAYERIEDKRQLTDRLSGFNRSTLIISAGNYYIFPKQVVQQENVEIINFHNALLPKIPGRNATTWAIYLGENVSGATWHYVTLGIDDGVIIAQKEVPITGDMRAWELSRDIVNAAVETFRGFFCILLDHHIQGRIQPVEKDRKVYFSYEIPNGGVCTMDMAAIDIYRLLRSVDYGKSGIFPSVRMRLDDGREMEVQRYSKVPSGRCIVSGTVYDREESTLYMRLDDDWELRIRYRD